MAGRVGTNWTCCRLPGSGVFLGVLPLPLLVGHLESLPVFRLLRPRCGIHLLRLSSLGTKVLALAHLEATVLTEEMSRMRHIIDRISIPMYINPRPKERMSQLLPHLKYKHVMLNR